MTVRSYAWDWNIAVFCRNERPYIGACLQAIANAIGTHNAIVTIIVNGSTDNSAILARDAARAHGFSFVVYTIPHGDKANAINQFMHRIREDARLYFFVDGYTRVSPTVCPAVA